MITEQEIKDIRSKINSILAEKKYLTQDFEKENEKRLNLEKRSLDLLEARIIIQVVSKKTQQLLESKFSTLVTLALQSVFQDDREFIIEFVEKRNKTEVECYIIKNGHKTDLHSGGGGQLDIISLGCRFAFWKLEGEKRGTFFLDEPLKFLHSPVYQERASEMLNMLAEKLKIQLIIVSDQNDVRGDIEYGVYKGEIYNVEQTEMQCPNCVKKGDKSLYFAYFQDGNEKFLRCKKCNEKVYEK